MEGVEKASMIREIAARDEKKTIGNRTVCEHGDILRQKNRNEREKKSKSETTTTETSSAQKRDKVEWKEKKTRNLYSNKTRDLE